MLAEKQFFKTSMGNHRGFLVGVHNFYLYEIPPAKIQFSERSPTKKPTATPVAGGNGLFSRGFLIELLSYSAPDFASGLKQRCVMCQSNEATLIEREKDWKADQSWLEWQKEQEIKRSSEINNFIWGSITRMLGQNKEEVWN